MENKDKDASTNRLQSLRLPRDLTLAVSKTSRRQFTPNLNVTRNKSQAPQKPEEKEKRPQERKERPNRNSKQPRFIQTEGIFSQGLAPSVQSSSQKRFSSSSSAAASRTSSTKTHRIKTEDVARIKAESSSDSEEENLVFAPILAPPVINAVSIGPTVEPCKEETAKGTVPLPFCDRRYSSENPALCLVNMPPVFRGAQYEEARDGDQIGKLQILKSGRMRVQIGDQWYDFDETDDYTSRQDAVLIKSEDGRPEAPPNYSMVELGSLMNSFTISVDYLDLTLNP